MLMGSFYSMTGLEIHHPWESFGWTEAPIKDLICLFCVLRVLRSRVGLGKENCLEGDHLEAQNSHSEGSLSSPEGGKFWLRLFVLRLHSGTADSVRAGDQTLDVKLIIQPKVRRN